MEAEIVSSPAAALEALQVADFDAALIDLNYTRDTTSGHEGLDLLSAIRNVDSDLPVIVMTAWANVDLAVQAMLRGARDFIQKPWENQRLLAVSAHTDRAESELAAGAALGGGEPAASSAGAAVLSSPNRAPRCGPCWS